MTAGCLVTEANRDDNETSYMFALHEINETDNFDEHINTWFDCAAFKNIVLYPNKVGHFANTSDPLANLPSLTTAKGQYRVQTVRVDDTTVESVVALVATANIDAGEEILVDYHWQLVGVKDGKYGRRYAHDCKFCKSKSAYAFA